MFKLIVVLFMILSLGSFAIANDVFTADISKTKVEWQAKKVTGEHIGTIALKSGMLKFQDGKLTGGEYEINMSSIVNHDLTDPEWNQKLVSHLKSDDFFSVDKFPVATFKITEVKSYTPKDANDKNNSLIKGEMTIKGITNSVEFPAQINLQDKVAQANAEITLDRTKWDVRFRSGKFFENLGDKLIYDDFKLTVNLVAGK